MKIPIRARNDYVLLRKVKPEKMSAGGLYIPEKAQERKMETEILSIGPGAFFGNGERGSSAMADLKVGMKVLVSRYGGVPVDGHEDLILVREGEIIGESRQTKEEGSK